jgi:tetratricopeptide (TPR) repeat protein
MKRGCRGGCVCVVFALVARAQGNANPGAPPSTSGLRAELQRAQAVLERALAARARYDLGVPVQIEPYVALSDAERARRQAAAEAQLLDEQTRVSQLSASLASAQDKLARVQQQVAKALAEGGEEAAAQAQPAASASATVDAVPLPFAADDDPAPAAPAAEPSSPSAAPAPVLLRGSEDHARVGRALFFAKRYERAREELQAAVAQRKDLVDLFYLARSHEALGDTAKADELYLQVEVQDTAEVAGKKQAGPWARAARVARRQMQWMRDNATWQPARPLEKVQWRAR